MKKFFRHHIRTLSAVLILAMLISALPLAASATKISQDLYDKKAADNTYLNPEIWNVNSHWKKNDKDLIVSIDDYDRYITPFPWADSGIRDEVYERVGIGSKNSSDTVINDSTHIYIPEYPVKGTAEEQAKWEKDYGWIVVSYLEHEHDLSHARWCYDNNYHWKNCPQCKKRVFLEWHADHDEDGVCDLCGAPIHFYTVSVKESEGGRITLSQDKGSMNDRIQVTVIPDAGYHLAEIHFYNNNEKHSELTRWEDVKGESYHFVILNWDIEAEAIFVKD